MVMVAGVGDGVAVGFGADFTGGFQLQGGMVDAPVMENMPHLGFDSRLVGDDMHGGAVVIAVNGPDVNVMDILYTGDAQQLLPEFYGVDRCFVQEYIADFS